MTARLGSRTLDVIEIVALVLATIKFLKKYFFFVDIRAARKKVFYYTYIFITPFNISMFVYGTTQKS